MALIEGNRRSHLPAFLQLPLRLFGRGSAVDELQVGRHRLAFLPPHKVQTASHHMHDAQLHGRLREDRLDGLREALQPVHAGDEDVLDAAIGQFG